MADQVTVDNGALTDYTVSTDDAGADGHVQRVKLTYSADGSATHVDAGADGLLVNLGTNNDVVVTEFDSKIGALTEAAPASDTASSGLNGRLQRIAQRITSLIALFPTSLGQKTKANSFAVTLASDQDALPVTDNSGSLTVDAPVGTPAFVRLSDGSSPISTLPVSAASLPSHDVTNAGTFPVQPSTFTASGNTTMQNAATATGNGTLLTVTGYGTALVYVTGTFVATITFEGTADGTNFHAINATQVGASTIATTATTTGLYRLSVAGLTSIRARISAYTSGSVTATGRTTNAPYASKVINSAQSGTWTVQPGNTANTTAWLVKEQRPATPAQSTVAASASSVQLLASTVGRFGATIYNDSTVNCLVKLGTTASATSFTVKMAPGTYYEVPFGYTGRIDGIWDSATGNARITEITA